MTTEPLSPHKTVIDEVLHRIVRCARTIEHLAQEIAPLFELIPAGTYGDLSMYASIIEENAGDLRSDVRSIIFDLEDEEKKGTGKASGLPEWVYQNDKVVKQWVVEAEAKAARLWQDLPPVQVPASPPPAPMVDPSTWTPQIIASQGDVAYATVLIEVRRCTSCKRRMVRPVSGPFAQYYRLSLAQQVERAGWTIATTDEVYGDGGAYCLECRKAGKITFTCTHCFRTYPTSEIQESFGYPAEHLCKSCYGTETAQEWDRITESLKDAHRWDFE